MKRLVVLNPLIEKLLSPENMAVLKEKLSKDFKADFIRDASPGIEKVKEEYQKLAKGEGIYEMYGHQKPIIDSRCPYITHFMVERYHKHLKSYLAPIDSILITGAEIQRKELNIDPLQLIVVTPCNAFRVFNDPIENRAIITWKGLKNILDFHPPQKNLDESPVPPGFFNYLEEIKIYSASGEEECEKLLSNIPDDADLLELLYCPGGCHRGDGL